MCKLYQPQGLEKIPKINKRRAFNKAQGLEKNAKLITVGPTSIPDSRVTEDQGATAGKAQILGFNTFSQVTTSQKDLGQNVGPCLAEIRLKTVYCSRLYVNLKLNIFFRNLTLTLFQLMVVIENLQFQVPMMCQMSRSRFTIKSAKTKLRLSKIHLPLIHTTCRQNICLSKKCCLWISVLKTPKKLPAQITM